MVGATLVVALVKHESAFTQELTSIEGATLAVALVKLCSLSTELALNLSP